MLVWPDCNLLSQADHKIFEVDSRNYEALFIYAICEGDSGERDGGARGGEKLSW